MGRRRSAVITVDNTVRLKIAPNSFSRISRRRNPRWSEHFDLEYVPAGFATGGLLDWPVLKDNLRLPRDFDDALYLELNPDLASAKIDLRKHYLLTGQREKRRYRRLDISGVATSPRLLLQRIRRQTLLRKS
jgi:hypothetical protein